MTSTQRKLLIAGAGGHGRVVADAALASGYWTNVAFLDDRPGDPATPEGWPVVGGFEDLGSVASDFNGFAAGLGDAPHRIDLLATARQQLLDLAPIIHPAAAVSTYCSIGEGSVVFAGGCVNVGASLNQACIVNTGATVDHDCRLGEGVHICPGAHLAGNVAIGDRTWFGAGAVAREGITIGADVTVGAGAVVVEDLPDGLTVVGNPARPLSKAR